MFAKTYYNRLNYLEALRTSFTNIYNSAEIINSDGSSSASSGTVTSAGTVTGTSTGTNTGATTSNIDTTNANSSKKPINKSYEDLYNAYLSLCRYKESTQVWMLVVAIMNGTNMTIKNKEKGKHGESGVTEATYSLPTLIEEGYEFARTGQDGIVSQTKLKKALEQNKDAYNGLMKNIDMAIKYYNVLAQANANE